MATAAAEHPNAELFRRGYAAFNSGDMDTVRETFDANIVWHTGGRNRFSRDTHGIDETLGFFLEPRAKIGVGNRDERFDAVFHVHAVQVGDAMFGNNVMDVRARGNDA